ncbi:hypothetical protein [Granulicella sp. dw_53]|uniref:hypothetical protein n=1 Tax=Granulicella sp. dw_53 TaxID=2719792 RepID=UPI001BD3EC81|nr:hypothetical protein [Granulicella sp. dw_53]
MPEVLRNNRLRRRAAELGTDVQHIVENDAAVERDDRDGVSDSKRNTDERIMPASRHESA